ncbi:hypothetical protein [Arcanobacterium haemolyticum]|uniref:Uncharacterized protein n=1 Tax=Arcanobacterium haemolyticum (strain ATCC 9345 / DSM 20595 / CCM 5947 / CCUG 17215 / LMG 16163 / NBRC 15585 / NCTC 8452 / 11018) TaxID=644284 RepID=D7BPD0_ARCHD|nr:hypothetical protein [Arcanobacterium haemolyticum]ADH92779.1 hypothetical protein Arch_1065 [Arcanobacterium haemolyticum DSM 20595]SQH28474.1 Uncharacterised protein [Arcanobacterium haemolyticum]
MSDAQRMSRRQMREQGRLNVRPADGVDISETTELHLHRPTRKELREARKTGTFPRIQEEISSNTGSEQEEANQPERMSVFDRFRSGTPEEDTSSAIATSIAEDQSKGETKSETDMPMRDRLLSMTRRTPADPEPSVSSADVARTSVMPEGAELEGEDLASLTPPSVSNKPSASLTEENDGDDMAYYDDDPTSPRRTILNYVLLLLIAVLVGLLIGFGINSLFFNAAPAVPAVDTLTSKLLL